MAIDAREIQNLQNPDWGGGNAFCSRIREIATCDRRRISWTETSSTVEDRPVQAVK
jgi:hypothetical protein